MRPSIFLGLLGGASTLACGVAHAQSASVAEGSNNANGATLLRPADSGSPATPASPDEAAPTPADGAKQADDSSRQDIVVTGSRVITNGNNSPTPVTVVTVQQLQATKPTTVFESLLDIPAFAGSRGGTSSNPSGNSATSGQISALNLRGLGPVRTLVLFDGHRVPPTEQDGFVDANTIPQLLLQRVDVVTGGASAVYGSDAIGGVVNFITDRKFVGVKVEAQKGISERGDAGTYQVGAAFGANLFGGRGHLEASFQRFEDDGILNRNARDQFLGRYTVQGNGCPGGLGSAACYPFYLVAGANNATWSYGGKIGGPANTATRTNPFLNYTFDAGGVLRPFVNGAAVPGSNVIQIGGDGIYDTTSSLKASSGINQAFGRFDFDVTSDIHYFVSGSYTRDHTFNNFGDLNSNSLVISSRNAFLAPAYQQQLINAGIATFTFSKKYGTGDLVPPTNIDNYTRTIYISTGLDGNIGQFKWDIGYNHSDVRLDTHSNFTFSNGPFYAALDAVVDPSSGKVVCNVTLTNPGLYPGCVPINLFGPASESQAAVDYVRRQGEFITKLPLDDVSANITGAPFSLWAGPVTVALSGEFRRQGFEVTSTNPTVNYAPLDCTGLRFNCVAPSATSVGTPSFNGGVPSRPPVHMDIAEGAIEANVPLLKDLPFVRSLNVDLAARYAKYSAVGNPDINASNSTTKFTAFTWKAGLDWHITDTLGIRATRSRDIRAPNLFELYQPNGITITNGNTDYLTNTNLTGTGALPQVVNGGNPNLKPEVAATITVGVVFRPSPKFSVAVDYFDIKVKDFITRLNGADRLFQQACYSGDAFYCSLQVRPGPITDTSVANAITRYYVVPANVAELSTKGVDVEANFQTDIGRHPFSARALATYQPHVYFKQPGAVVQDFAGALGTPVAYATSAKVRAAVYLHYSPVEDFSVDWETRFRGKMHQSPDPTLISDPSADAAAAAFSNLTLSLALPAPRSGKAVLYLNVQNIFDKKSPVAASYTNAASPGIADSFVLGDDPTGRYFRVGARFRW